ncbi:hypothetical protein Lfu02_74260 [Longispora fulva]|nr:hypothetical protein Lfu02_74260 [Longispora fulva]
MCLPAAPAARVWQEAVHSALSPRERRGSNLFEAFRAPRGHASLVSFTPNERTRSVATATEEWKQQAKDIVCDILEIEPDEVTETSLFKEEHGADSLRAIEILAALERNFNITIDQSELGGMVNLDGVYTVVAKAANWN